MKVYRFEVEAFEEIDIKADSLEEAKEKAKEYWYENFSTMFGSAEFKEIVEDE